jgi:hypothetical protein
VVTVLGKLGNLFLDERVVVISLTSLLKDPPHCPHPFTMAVILTSRMNLSRAQYLSRSQKAKLCVQAANVFDHFISKFHKEKMVRRVFLVLTAGLLLQILSLTESVHLVTKSALRPASPSSSDSSSVFNDTANYDALRNSRRNWKLKYRRMK